MRFAQTGYWTGTLEVGGEHFDITPDRWWGTRDRSWGVRPVGEKEPPGIRGAEGQMGGMWNYSPMQFTDYSILYILNETDDGERLIEEAVRIWADPSREPEWLGRPEYEHTLVPGTRMVSSSVLSFPDAPGGGFDVEVTPLTHVFIAVGTGYGMEEDWRHGMYQGPLVVQGVEHDMDELEKWALVRRRRPRRPLRDRRHRRLRPPRARVLRPVPQVRPGTRRRHRAVDPLVRLGQPEVGGVELFGDLVGAPVSWIWPCSMIAAVSATSRTSWANCSTMRIDTSSAAMRATVS